MFNFNLKLTTLNRRCFNVELITLNTSTFFNVEITLGKMFNFNLKLSTLNRRCFNVELITLNISTFFQRWNHVEKRYNQISTRYQRWNNVVCRLGVFFFSILDKFIDAKQFVNPFTTDVHKMVTCTITILQHMHLLQNCCCVCVHFVDIRNQSIKKDINDILWFYSSNFCLL